MNPKRPQCMNSPSYERLPRLPPGLCQVYVKSRVRRKVRPELPKSAWWILPVLPWRRAGTGSSSPRIAALSTLSAGPYELNELSPEPFTMHTAAQSPGVGAQPLVLLAGGVSEPGRSLQTGPATAQQFLASAPYPIYNCPLLTTAWEHQI